MNAQSEQPRTDFKAKLTAHLSRAWSAIERFAFAPASALPLSILRIGIAATLIAQALLIAPSFLDLYAQTGILQGALRDRFSYLALPHIHWPTVLLSPLGLGESTILDATGLIYVFALVCLLLGWGTRKAAVAAWFTHLMLFSTGLLMNYGVDWVANSFLVYLIWIPSGALLSLDRWAGRAPPTPSPAARLSLRVIQVHLCIAYLAGGLEKAMGEQWWNGEAVWRALKLPIYGHHDVSWLAHVPWLAVIAGWAVLIIEIGYPVFIWPRLTRRVWVLATVGMHLGIALFVGLSVFGAFMMVPTFAVFGVSAEPRARGAFVWSAASLAFWRGRRPSPRAPQA